MRESDQYICYQQIIIHIIFILLSTSVWVLPYLIAFIIAVLAYDYGMQAMLSLLLFCIGMYTISTIMNVYIIIYIYIYYEYYIYTIMNVVMLYNHCYIFSYEISSV